MAARRLTRACGEAPEAQAWSSIPADHCLMIRLAIAFVSVVLVSCAQDDDAKLRQAISGKYIGYPWPVAPGCTPRTVTNPNFANNSRRRPDGSKRPHLGFDIIPPANDLHFYTAKKGIVVVNSPARRSGWGNNVVIKHEDGLMTRYAHLVTPSALRVGIPVSKGGIVGIAGQTETFYVHAHFEVQLTGTSSDWTKGRLAPASVAGPLNRCKNSAAPGIR